MRAWLLAVLLVAAPVLTGCLGLSDDDGDAEKNSLTDVTGGLLAQDVQRWEDPLTSPHPAFDYPTLTTVPEDAPSWWQPIQGAALPSDITGMDPIADTTDEIDTGNGIALFGSLAIVSGNPATIVDIGGPTDEVVLSEIDVSTRDADTIAYPDGRLVAIFATGSGILPYYDITDPTDPQPLGELEPTDGTHNVAVVPGTPIVYNSNSAGSGFPVGSHTADDAPGITEIYDLTDPEAPVHVQDWNNGFGCHDITFYMGEDKLRGYCAGIQMTQIWEMADPVDPQVIVNVPVHHGNPALPSTEVPITFFSHLAMTNKDATVLIVGDETGGGAAPGCDGPGYAGNLWFYDISDEETPELQGWWSPHPPALTTATQDNAATCTAHFGRLVPSEDRDLLAMAFYGAGVTLLDFTDPSSIQLIDQWNQGTNTWDVWYYDGYLFTGDISRGMDVLELTG